MGTRGPAPTPTPILRARGSWRAKERVGEVQFPPGRPACPAWLGKEARAEWRRVVVALEAAGVLAVVDRAALAAYCEAWGEFHALAGEVAKVGAAEAIALGLTSAKSKAVQRMLQLAGQFGFTPAARARIKGPAPEADDTSGKARYFAS